MKIILAIAVFLPCILAAYEDLDPRFAVDPREIQWNEMSKDIRKISGAVMGIAELVVEMKADVRTISKDIGNNNLGRNGESHDHNDQSKKYESLAGRIEKLLAVQNTTEVQLVKEDIRRTVEINFIRILSAMLVTGPMKTQERQEDILKLMKTVLNGNLDFSQVVEKLPFIMRDSETNQFINLLKTLKETEDFRGLRQDNSDGHDNSDGQEDGQVEESNQGGETQAQGTAQQGTVQQGTVQQGTAQQGAVQQGTAQQGTATAQQAMMMKQQQSGLNQVIDAMGKLDISQLANFIGQIPQIFQGIETLVEGAEDTFGNFGS